MNEKTVPPNLDYLRAIQNQGHRLTDIRIVMQLPGMYKSSVYVNDSDSPIKEEFIIYCDNETLHTHFLEAVEFTGFGPRRLSNVIHAEVLQKAKAAGMPVKQFQAAEKAGRMI